MEEVGRRLKGRGICVYIWLIHDVVQKKLTQHCKAIIFQLKAHTHKKIIIKPSNLDHQATSSLRKKERTLLTLKA